MTGYILVVDDQSDVRCMLVEFLTESGFRVKSASNGWDCLRITRSTEKPMLILLDNQMPNITGIEVLSILKNDSSTREIPVIMVSGTDNMEEIAKKHGACAVFTKPPNFNTLLQEIQEVMIGIQSKYKVICQSWRENNQK